MIRAFITDRSGTRVSTVPGWAVGLGAFGAALLGLTVLVIGAGLALLLAPLAIAAVMLARWRLKSLLRSMAGEAGLAAARAQASQAHAAQAKTSRAQATRQADPSVIDADYRVINDGRG